MASSGIALSEEATEIVKRLVADYKKNSLPGAVLRVQESAALSSRRSKTNSVEYVEGTYHQNIQRRVLKRFRSHFKDDDCCYVLCYLNNKINPSQPVDKIVPCILHWVPDSCGVKKKMLSSTTIESLKIAAERLGFQNADVIAFSALKDVTCGHLWSESKQLRNSKIEICQVDGRRIKSDNKARGYATDSQSESSGDDSDSGGN